MSSNGNEDTLLPPAARPVATPKLRYGAIFMAIVTAQYTLIAICVSLTVGGALHFLVTPRIVAQYEAIATALKR